MHLNYAIVFVSDMAESVRFYRDTIGLTLKFESPEWTEFMTGGATFALHRGEQGIENTPSPDVTAPGQCRPGFSVDNLDEFHSHMIANDVNCVQPPKNVFGARIAQYSDPDGVVISVSEVKSGT